MKRVLLFITCALLSLFSCKNNIEVEKSHKPSISLKKIQSSRLSISCSPDNSANPYDSVGRIHNEAIAHLIEKDSLTDIQTAYLATINYFKKHYSYTSTTPSSAAVLATIESIKNNQLSFISNSAVRNKLRDLLHICERDSTDFLSNPEYYCVIKQEIVDWEASLLADISFSIAEKQQILAASSIARHSRYLWLNALSDLSPSERSSFSFKRFFKIIACDAIGGYIGGSVSGGIGFLVGAALCSVGAILSPS